MKLQGWENTMNMLAIANINSALQKEAETEDARKETSKWYLERRMKEHFSQRVENTGADGKDLFTYTPEIKQQVEQALDNINE